jgi:hypothetical protein
MNAENMNILDKFLAGEIEEVVFEKIVGFFFFLNKGILIN